MQRIASPQFIQPHGGRPKKSHEGLHRKRYLQRRDEAVTYAKQSRAAKKQALNTLEQHVNQLEAEAKELEKQCGLAAFQKMQTLERQQANLDVTPFCVEENRYPMMPIFSNTAKEKYTKYLLELKQKGREIVSLKAIGKEEFHRTYVRTITRPKAKAWREYSTDRKKELEKNIEDGKYFQQILSESIAKIMPETNPPLANHSRLFASPQPIANATVACSPLLFLDDFTEEQLDNCFVSNIIP